MMDKKYIGYGLGLAILIGLLYYSFPKTSQTPIRSLSPLDCDNSNEMVRLWMEHVLWLRNYTWTCFHTLPSEGAVLNRLLQNQQQLADYFSNTYNVTDKDATNNIIYNLLVKHILLTSDLMKSLRGDNLNLRRIVLSKWHYNIDNLVVYLCKIKPTLEESSVKELFYRHLEYTKETIMAYHHGMWDQDIDSANKMTDNIQKLSKILSS